jgi:RimJ/RimL family protein N-acetyltransferase
MPDSIIKHVPYCIQSPRLIIRCYNPSDAHLLKQSVDQSLAELKIWMPWAKYEPTSIEAKVQRLRLMRGQFDLDQDYTYGIFNLEQNFLIGGTGLHKRGAPDTLEIGYWIHSKHVGLGYASEVAQSLTQVAFESLGAQAVEIRCAPDNLASAAIPEKLGFSLDQRLFQNETTPTGEPRDTLVWRLSQQEFNFSQFKQIPLRLWDARGQERSQNPNGTLV